MIIPSFLSRDDTIGVTAPSDGIYKDLDRRRLAQARRFMEERGYHIRETPDVYMHDASGRSCSAEQRVEEWDSLFKDPSVKAVYAASGGDYESEMLPLMDWDLIERNPKWFQGYSDNTTLMFKITAEHDIATAYCGNFGDFGMVPLHRSVIESLEVLEGSRTSQDSFERHASGFSDRVTGLEPFLEDEKTVWVSDRGDADVSGRLIGGCTDVITWLADERRADASSFVDRYSDEGIVWYLETFSMDEDTMRSMFRKMDSLGWFEGCSGFVFGRPLFYDGPMGYTDMVRDALSEFDVPVITDADVGHKAPRMIFINGAKAELSIRGDACRISYDLHE